MATEETPTGPYGLSYPNLSDIREALTRVHGDDSAELWPTLLDRAQLTGDEQDRPSADRLIEVMARCDGATRLTAHALRIRARSFDHLTAAHEIIRSAQ